MNIDQNSLITLTVILATTLIGVVALIRNTPVTLRINLGKDKSFILEGKTPLLIPEKTKIDCLPGKENSQICDN